MDDREPNCRLFVSLRGYDYHIMRCGDRLQTREQMLRTLDAQNPARARARREYEDVRRMTLTSDTRRAD